jgi:hypothetical protein
MALRNLRKVGQAAQSLTLPSPARVTEPEVQEAALHPQQEESLSLAEVLAHRREVLAPESSDESSDHSDSTEF